MIVFDTALLTNTLRIDAAEDLRDGQFISKEEFQAFKARTPTLKTNRNLFFRIAFFILGSFCYSSVGGVIALVAVQGFDKFEAISFLFAIFGIVAAELLARGDHYAHGLDDAAILGFLGCLAGASAVTTSSTPFTLTLVAIASATCVLRYLHTLSVLVSIGSIVGLIANLAIEYHIILQLYLTFVVFAFSVGLFFAHRKLSKSPKTKFYKNPMLALQFCSLLLAYFSMNYMVVRELAQDLMGFSVEVGKDIPLAFIFYFFTFAIPVFYLVLALRERNRMMLWIGLFTLGYSIFTIRLYYHIIPTEWALLLGGAALLAFSLFCIRKLKKAETGITFQKDRMHDSRALSVAQAVIVNSQATHIPAKAPIEFGGGGFSGGGAGESY
jgi:hypothetical protein